jgi:hypothetical protein
MLFERLQPGADMRALRSIIATLYLVLLLFVHSAQAECPNSCVGDVCSSRASADTTVSSENCYAHSGYDVAKGSLFTHISGGISFCWTWAEAKIEDDFVLDGIPSGTPVSLAARLQYSASWWCGGCPGGSYVNAEITQGATSTTWSTPSCDLNNLDCAYDQNAALLLPIQAIAGTPFRVSFNLWGSAAESIADILGHISFDGLPAHAVIRSCNGFVQGEVPTLPISWGQLKAAYR